MSLVVMGISYKTASIEQRAGAAVPETQVPALLTGLCARDGVKGAVVLSTCNRVEVYLDAETDRTGTAAVHTFFADRMGTSFVDDRFYLLRGQGTVRHAYRVVCSLDSQLLGEAQILGQMRRAYQLALDAGTASETLSRLFTSAFALGKQVRTQTAIGADSVSLSTTAYQVACENVPDITRARVFLLGAGEMARLAAKYLVEGGVGVLAVTSRTLSHARALAQDAGATVVPFDERYRAIAHSDVVFCMIAADQPVVRADELRRALEDGQASGALLRNPAKAPDSALSTQADSGRQPIGDSNEAHGLVFIDEAVPRNVEPACGAIAGVQLFDLDHLTAIVDEGMSRRINSVPHAERLVAQAERAFLAWMQERLVTPTIKAVHQKGELIVQGELAHVIRELEKQRGATLTEGERQTLASYGNAVMKKILHGPTVRLRKEAHTADSYYYTGAARYLFGLDAYPPGTHHHDRAVPAKEGDAALAADDASVPGVVSLTDTLRRERGHLTTEGDGTSWREPRGGNVHGS